MKIRRFNDAGLAQFRLVIADRRQSAKVKRSVEPIPRELLESDEFTESTIFNLLPDRPVFHTKFDIADAIFRMIPARDFEVLRVDAELWSWMAGWYFDEITNGRKKLKEERAYIAKAFFQNDYRHLILGPCFVATTARDDRERVRVLLYDEPTTMNEVMTQFGSHHDYLMNPVVQGVVKELYWDPSRGRTKHGSGGKNPGSPRRLMDCLNQLELNYDLRSISTDRLLSLLPEEFDKFRPSPKK
jgi:hypothetical protein